MARIDAFGKYGFDQATTGTLTADSTTPHWFAIQAVADSQVDVTNVYGDSVTNLPIPAGVTIYVTAVSITVDSGNIIAYRAK